MIDIAARFVQDVIEKARTEATAKMNSETLVNNNESYREAIELTFHAHLDRSV